MSHSSHIAQQGATVRRSVGGGPPGLIGLAGMAAIVAITAAFGGLAPADAGVDSVPLDTAYAAGEFDITVHSATLTAAVESQYLEAEPGFEIVVVEMTVLNHGTTSTGATSTTPALSSTLFTGTTPVVSLATATDESPTAWYADGLGRAPVFQPGVPAQIAVAWMVPADALAAGDDAGIQVRSYTVATGQVLISDQSRYFRVRDVAAVLTAPLTETELLP